MLPLPLVWGLFGLVIGSFLNVCIHRIPKRESIVFPGSHCPHCNAPVRPYDNIPVLSYVVLGGKCRSCHAPISPRYPLVELLTAAAFVAAAARWGPTAPAFVNSLFLAAIVVLVLIDYDHQILPDVITLPGIAVGIALSPLQWPPFYRDPISSSLALALPGDADGATLAISGALVGALFGGGLLGLVAFLYKAVRHKQGLGMGDVKMMAMVGAFLGWRL